VRRAITFLSSFLASIAVAGSGVSLSDVDIEGISSAARTVTRGQIAQFFQPSTACALTAEEEPCQLEVHVVIAGDPDITELTISKIQGHWVIGRWQTELLAFSKCVREKHTWSGCYGPSGHVGGVRKTVTTAPRDLLNADP
jgi:hypothetical protein